MSERLIRVVMPLHLRRLAQVDGEVTLALDADAVTHRLIHEALEAAYPALRGTIRDQRSGERRPMVRFFACEEDRSHEPVDTPLPEAIAMGEEPYYIVGAIAGG